MEKSVNKYDMHCEPKFYKDKLLRKRVALVYK